MSLATDKASQLTTAMKNVPLAGFDRSFKMTKKALLGHRFLMGVDTKHIEAKRLRGICAGMGMPAEYATAFAENLPDANSVHFGFEENENSCVYKVYLEFWAKLHQHIRNKETGGSLLHLAFKWDPLNDRKKAITEYVCHPYLCIEAILERMGDIFNDHADKPSCEITQKIIKLAAPRITDGAPMYLEVCEADNPRKSFDINLHPANLKLLDIEHLLNQMSHHYEIPTETFQMFYNTIRASTLGHISAGIDRHNRDFMTTYYE
ncbi:MAG: hypothetical protein ACI8PW_001666 [Methylophilaceae bacterium]